jgi:autotransporter-associated beta strand protein
LAARIGFESGICKLIPSEGSEVSFGEIRFLFSSDFIIMIISSSTPALRAVIRFASLTSIAFALVCLGKGGTVNAQIPAFPGAEGFGAHSTGGRGGDVYIVTNLNASGAGSFAEAISTVPSSGRTIVFAVSGYIRLPSGSGGTRMTASKVTIAGQTAPGDGIGFYNNTFRISGADVIVRHLRFRRGKTESRGDCLDLDSGAQRTMLDHVALQFSTDENMSSFNSPPNWLTLQNSLNAWGLQSHSAGGLWDQNHATSVLNLWAHNHTRNPKARPWGLLDWINNVTYDWGIGFIMGDSETPAPWKANVIGNYFVCPPGNIRSVALEKARLDRHGNPNFTLFAADNLFDRNGNSLLDGTDFGYGIASGSYATAPSRMAASGGVPVTPFPPRLAYKRVVSSSGPLRLNALAGMPLRDEVDTHLMNNLLQFRRNQISNPNQLPVSNSGFGALNSLPAPLDTDRDGMPDYWETSLGWNSSVQDHNVALPSSGGLITGGTFFPPGTRAGYTRLEEYLHFLASPHTIVARNTAGDPSAATFDLSRYTLGFNDHDPIFTLSNVIGGTVAQSGPGGRTVTFTPTLNQTGRARFEFAVTDSQGDSWTQSFLILVSPSGAPRDLVWQGDNVSNQWSTTGPNWIRSGSSTAFNSGDNALFDDRGSATPAIHIPATIASGTLTFDSSKNYTLAGSGAFMTGTLSKRGPGRLTISNTATNSIGSIVHEEGELALTKANAAGGASIRLTGGVLTLSPDAVGSNIPNPLQFDVPTVINVTTQHNSTGAWTGPGDITVNTSALWTIIGPWSGYSGRITLGSNGTPRIRLNGTSNTNFGSAALAIDLGEGSGQFMNRNGGGTPYAIGTLTGGPNTQLQGTQTPNGTNSNTSTYSIGARGEEATFHGAIRNGGSTAAVATLINKVGAGTWTLTGTSTHSGLTTVSGGELRLDGGFSASPITVASGATLSGSGSSGGLVTIQSGGRLSPGADDGTPGTFTAVGGLTAGNGATFSFDLGSNPNSSADRINVSAGTTALSGTVTFQIHFLDLDNGLAPGTYPLITGDSTLTASGLTMNAAVAAPAGTTRQTFNLVRPASGTKPGFVNLAVTGAASGLTWSGPSGGGWDLATTVGNFSGASDSVFYNLDRVHFDDTAPGGTVNLTGTLRPAVVTVDASTRNYTFAGSGSLAGSARLVKSGAGTLTLTNSAAHTYTGGVELHEGRLALTSTASPLGSGLVRIHGGTLVLPNAATFLSNNFLFSGAAALSSPYGGNSTIANGTANTFASDGDATVSLAGLVGILSINGRMEDFVGTLDWGNSPGMLRLNANSNPAHDVNTGSPDAHFALGTSGRLTNRNGGLVINLGAVSGGSNSLLSGRQSGSGSTSTTYRVGALGIDTTFEGSIRHGGDGGGIQVVKTGVGSWTLGGDSDFIGSLEIENGMLRLSGSLVTSGQTTVYSGAALELERGDLASGGLFIADGAQLRGHGLIRNDLNNAGTILVSGPGTLTVEGDIVNDGMMRISSGASLAATGTFVNNGVLDMLTAAGDLPANFVNEGTVIDRSAVRLSLWSREGDAFSLRIASHTGHTYVLQMTPSLDQDWADVESVPGESGQEVVFIHDPAPDFRAFYRIAIR